MSLDYERVMSKIIKSRVDAIKRYKDEEYRNLIAIIETQIGLAVLAIDAALDVKQKTLKGIL